MKILGALLLTLLLATPVLAQSGYKYDPRSGNSYNWYQQSDGSTNVRGSNLNTGSQWNTTIKPNGDQNGFDSRGNSWRYDNRSGNYWNSNGTTCFGKGAARQCY